MEDRSNHPGAPAEKPIVQLIGRDGNAGSIMGRVIDGLREAGASREYTNLVRMDMMSGNYDHLLFVAMQETEMPELDDEDEDDSDEDEWDEPEDD